MKSMTDAHPIGFNKLVLHTDNIHVPERAGFMLFISATRFFL